LFTRKSSFFLSEKKGKGKKPVARSCPIPLPHKKGKKKKGKKGKGGGWTFGALYYILPKEKKKKK